jgi:hypothetical protein
MTLPAYTGALTPAQRQLITSTVLAQHKAKTGLARAGRGAGQPAVSGAFGQAAQVSGTHSTTPATAGAEITPQTASGAPPSAADPARSGWNQPRTALDVRQIERDGLVHEACVSELLGSSSELMSSGILPGTSASVHDGTIAISAK